MISKKPVLRSTKRRLASLLLLFAVPLVSHCVSASKSPLQNDQAVYEAPSEGLMDQVRYLSREVQTVSQENVDFLLKKLKVARRKYKVLQKRLTALEKKVQQLILQIQNRDDVEITVEEETENSLINEKPSLFEKERPADKSDSPSQRAALGAKSDQEAKQALAAGESESARQDLSPERFFIQGQTLFIEQSWEKAIEALEEYRSKFPKGAQYPSATYLIGRAFQELDMEAEAQIFFKELAAGHPGSPFAEKAEKLIKKL